VLGALGALRERMAESAERRLRLAKQRLDQFATRPAFRRPLQRVLELEQRLDDTASRLARAARLKFSQATQKLAEVSARLETLSPLQVLSRGYSLTHTADGRLVRDAGPLRPGDLLITRVADGLIRSLVTEVKSTKGEHPPQGGG
jgi:exodeoxyribonuclease VII large subunit